MSSRRGTSLLETARWDGWIHDRDELGAPGGLRSREGRSYGEQMAFLAAFGILGWLTLGIDWGGIFRGSLVFVNLLMQSGAFFLKACVRARVWKGGRDPSRDKEQVASPSQAPGAAV